MRTDPAAISWNPFVTQEDEAPVTLTVVKSMSSDALQHKAKRVFGSRIVNKALARHAGFTRIPNYVAEHIITKYSNPDNLQASLKQLRERIVEVVPTPDNRERLKAQIIHGQRTVIFDKLTVHVDIKTGTLVGTLSNLGERTMVHKSLVAQMPRLLNGGLWGAIALNLIPNKQGKGHILDVDGMAPFQCSGMDLSEYVASRREFSDQEWIDLLIASVGYDPTQYSERAKLMLMVRLIPLVEPNVNIIELGPRQTGKTYLLRNLTSSVYVASGANVTAASMFHNVASGAPGIISHYKIVVLDEIANTTFDGASVVSMLKDYMESGQYGRGGLTQTSDASIVMTGNIDVSGSAPSSRYRHWFEPLPEELQDLAFLDRVHALVPGWDIPKISAASIYNGSGLAIDYLSQIMQELHDKDFRDLCHRHDTNLGATRRDIVAVEKLSSGLFKLMHPDGKVTEQQWVKVVNLAKELRASVMQQLAIMAPGEFGRHYNVEGGV